MPVYRKKPIEIEAFKWNSTPLMKYPHWLFEGVSSGAIQMRETGECVISTLEGDMLCNVGDYIIKGVQGELYPCKADIFEETYQYMREEL
jgi:hypothetical protein